MFLTLPPVGLLAQRLVAFGRHRAPLGETPRAYVRFLLALLFLSLSVLIVVFSAALRKGAWRASRSLLRFVRLLARFFFGAFTRLDLLGLRCLGFGIVSGFRRLLPYGFLFLALLGLDVFCDGLAFAFAE